MGSPNTMPGTSNSPRNSFLSPSKGLRNEEKNEGVPLVFVGRVAQWEHLPLALVPNQAARCLSSPPSNCKPGLWLCKMPSPSPVSVRPRLKEIPIYFCLPASFSSACLLAKSLVSESLDLPCLVYTVVLKKPKVSPCPRP